MALRFAFLARFLSIVACLLPRSAGGECADYTNTPRVVGHLYLAGGSAVATAGSFAYVAGDYGRSFDVVDVTDPAAPMKVAHGSLGYTHPARGMCVAGDTLVCVTCDMDRVVLMDVRDPRAPCRVGSIPVFASDVSVEGRYAYLAASDLVIADVHDPGSPELMSSVPAGNAVGVALEMPHAFVADALYGLRVFDVSDSWHPIEIASVATPGNPTDVALFGSYACVTTWYAGLQVIDVANPLAPSLIGSPPTAEAAVAVASDSGHVFVAGEDNALGIFDLSTPAAPEQVFEAYVQGGLRGLVLAAECAYVAELHEGLQVVDVLPAEPPREVGFLSLPDETWNTAVSDAIVYAACGTAGLLVIDTSNPESLEVIGGTDTPDVARDVALSGDVACVADVSTVRTYDTSDPAHPSLLDALPMPGYARGVAAVGTIAYVAAGVGGLRMIDISEPADLHVLGWADTYGGPDALAVSGRCAVVVDTEGGWVEVIDVSDPVHPQRIGGILWPEVWDVDLQGNHAYMATTSGGLLVLDVSNPADPRPVASAPTGPCYGVDVLGGVAYVSNSQGVVDPSGVFVVVDITDPLSPTVIGRVPMPADGKGVAVSDEWACAALGRNGIGMFHPHCVAAGVAENPFVPGPELLRSRPNPVRDGAWIRYWAPGDRATGVALYDCAGRRIRLLPEAPRTPGLREVYWNGRDVSGRELPSGVYMLCLDGPARYACRRIVIAR